MRTPLASRATATSTYSIIGAAYQRLCHAASDGISIAQPDSMNAHKSHPDVDDCAPAPAAHGVREKIGAAIGGVISPIVATVARVRKARMFHPEGQLFEGHLEATVTDGPYADLAHRLGRTVLARLSGALSRNQRERFEVLGIALRFHRGAKLSTRVAETDQDLLLATITSPFTMGIAPFTTNAHDFLANRYYAVAPFEFGGDHRIEVRLSPQAHAFGEGARADRVAAAVEAGEAVFQLEVKRTLTRTWIPIATLRLTRALDLDQEDLRFDPFQSGENLRPVGVVHAIRKAAYAASQKARSAFGHHQA